MVGSFSASVVITPTAVRTRAAATGAAGAARDARAAVAPRPHARRWLAALVLLVGGTLALYTATAAFGVAVGRAGRELALVNAPSPVLRAGHLLATSLYRAVIAALAALGVTAPPVAAIHLTNAAMAAAAVGLYFVLLARLRASSERARGASAADATAHAGVGRAAAAAALLAVCAPLWHPAVGGDPAVTALPFALGACLLLVPGGAGVGARLGAGRVVGAGLLFALAIDLWLQVALVLPVAALLVARAFPAAAAAARRRSLAALAVVLVLGGAPLAWAVAAGALKAEPGVTLSPLPAWALSIAAAALWLPPLRARAAVWGARAGVVLACALLLVANQRPQAPSLLHPQGGADWQRARRAAAALRAGDLVVGPSGAPLLWTPQLGARARALDLGTDVPATVDAQEYEAVVWSAVHDAYARGGRVFIEGLAGDDPLPEAWRDTEARHGVTRARLAALLDHEFIRRPAPALGPGVDQLLPRR
jgi:hypothetical protein